MLIYQQDKKLIAAIHCYQRYKSDRTPIKRVLCAWGKLRHMFWTVVSGSDIDRDATIHPTARFPHLNGVVLHRDAVVSEGCMVMQQVTLGQVAHSSAPHLGPGAYVGAGAKILGDVRIGAGASIGANAVVLSDVPEGATAVGIPAVVKKIKAVN